MTSWFYVGPDRIKVSTLKEGYSVATDILKKELGASVEIYKSLKTEIPMKRLEYRPDKDRKLRLVVYDLDSP